ncbi:MAG: hypothetical protein IT265_16370 [Saprospiraceae bacterium]|nr:hypothetical protein [Saprospiraceae bacterium]
MKHTIYIFILLTLNLIPLSGQLLLDSYADGNFTSSPIWSGDDTHWQIVSNSNAGPGATGSNTLRLDAQGMVAGTRYLSSQIEYWGAQQEWGFWVGRSLQAFTTSNQMHIWLYANESNLNNATVDGYRLTIGDDSGNDEIRLEYIVDGAVNATVLTSTGALTNGLTDIGFLIRITRSLAGEWVLYTSTLPVSNGEGVSATTIPNSTNASVNQGNATHNVLSPSTNGYLGVLAIHTSAFIARNTVEFDQIYFTTDYQYEITTTGNNLVVTDLEGNAETLDITESGSNIVFNASGRTYSLNGGLSTTMPISIPISGLNSITVNTGAGNDLINIGEFVTSMPSMTINGGTNDDVVDFIGDITFNANANLDVNLQNDDAITGLDRLSLSSLSNLVLLGTGSATIKVSYYVLLSDGSSITTQNGDLTVEANQQLTPSSGIFTGITIFGALLQSSGSGTIVVRGKGGNSSNNQRGINVSSAGKIQGGTSGAVIVEGIGGASTGIMNHGVHVIGANSIISSNGADVSVTGLSGGSSSSFANFGVYVHGAGVISAGGSGTVTVMGTSGSATGSTNYGVYVTLSNASITSSGGNVSVIGQGGGSSFSGNNNGVYVSATGIISATGDGTLTVMGTGGSGSGHTNYGILLSGSNSQITSINGNLSLIGQGGGSGVSFANYGIYFDDNSIVSTTGNGTLSILGTGGNSTGTGNFNIGVLVDLSNVSTASNNLSITGQGGGSINSTGNNSGVHLASSSIISAGGSGLVSILGVAGPSDIASSGNHGTRVDAGAMVTSSGGNVSVMGQGTGSGASGGNYGVEVTAGGMITAGGTGAVTVMGTGGAGTGSNNYGIYVISNTSKITSGGGNVSLTGVEGGGATGTGIVSNSLGSITTLANGGNINLVANSIDIKNTTTVSTNGVGSVTLKPLTNNVQIDLGSSSDPIGGSLGISDNEIDRITTGKLIIGDINSGDIQVTGAITRTTSTNMELHSGADVAISGGGINTNGGILLLDPANAPFAVKPTFTGTDVTASVLSFASDLAILINGTTLGDGTGATYSQLAVVGSVDLTGVNLLYNGAYVPVHNDSFVIVYNDGVDAIIGNFIGLSEGASISNFMGSGLMAVITYLGGDGNDAVLKVSNAIYNASDNIYYPSLTAALASGTTGDGDVLEIPSGTYIGPCITISKSVTLKPIGGPVTFDCITMNGAEKIMILGGNFTINQLILTNGKIRTNGYNLKCGTVTGGSLSTYVITD